jgi:SAM-dependent methyltransferase
MWVEQRVRRLTPALRVGTRPDPDGPGGRLTGVWMPTPAFASDPATAHYYDRRAAEYDEWYTGQGSFAGRDRPGWTAEVDQLVNLVRHLPPARTLDVACGTAFLTRHLRGFVVGLDQSPSMVAIAQSRLPDGLALVGDALHLVVADHAFDRVMTGHFYGHLPPGERAAFLGEASRHRVYKRYLSGDQLAEELDGQVLMDGRWFVVARVSWVAHEGSPTDP